MKRNLNTPCWRCGIPTNAVFDIDYVCEKRLCGLRLGFKGRDELVAAAMKAFDSQEEARAVAVVALEAYKTACNRDFTDYAEFQAFAARTIKEILDGAIPTGKKENRQAERDQLRDDRDARISDADIRRAGKHAVELMVMFVPAEEASRATEHHG